MPPQSYRYIVPSSQESLKTALKMVPQISSNTIIHLECADDELAALGIDSRAWVIYIGQQLTGVFLPIVVAAKKEQPAV